MDKQSYILKILKSEGYKCVLMNEFKTIMLIGDIKKINTSINRKFPDFKKYILPEFRIVK